MPSIFKALSRPFKQGNKLLNEGQHNRIPSSIFFLNVDIDKLKRKYKVEREAAERGAQGLPSPEDQCEDDFETRIISEILDEESRSYQDFDGWMRQNATDIADVRTKLSDKRALDLADTASKFYESETVNGLNYMASARENVPLAKRGLEHFRAKNEIFRPARYSDSHWPGRVIAMALVFLEVGANSVFLSKGSEAGYVGGFLEALLIACVNIGLAYGVIWWFIGWTNHKALATRLAGYFWLTAFALFIFFFNLFGAHYRDAMIEVGKLLAEGAIPDFSATQQAGRTFWSNPFGIYDFQSWVMVFIGCLFAAGTAFHRYRQTDPYPGYEDEDRAHRLKYDDYSRRYTEYVGHLEEHLRRFNRNMVQERDQMAALARLREEKAATRETMIRSFRAHRDGLERNANELLSLYRQTNRQARPPGIATPPYFDKPWILRERDLPQLGLASTTTEEINRRVDELQALIDEKREMVSRKYDECLARFREIDSLIRSPDLGAQR